MFKQDCYGIVALVHIELMGMMVGMGGNVEADSHCQGQASKAHASQVF